MNDTDVRALVHAAIRRVAPEADPDSVPAGSDFREALDIDSMDFLNFVDELHTRTGIDVPERDYPSLASINGCVAYVTERWAQRPVAGG